MHAVADPPLTRGSHAESLRQCEVLARLVLCIGQGAPVTYTSGPLRGVLDWFDAELGRQSDDPTVQMMWARMRGDLLAALRREAGERTLQDAEEFILAMKAHLAADLMAH
jgi:hypothetical protein